MTTMRELPKLPSRPKDGHKGTFGKVCVIGGQASDVDVMIGGPAFSALSALRSGCGLAVLAMPRGILEFGLAVAPSATGLALPVDGGGRLKASEVASLIDDRMDEIDCFAIGPGFGFHEAQQQIVIRLLAQDEKPVVVDADGLNALAMSREFHRDVRAPAVLTPHPGEFARLAAALGVTADVSSDAKRIEAATMMAQRLGCVMVLKGHRTIVSNGQEAFVNSTGGPSLATAGTGDVLTGIIASMIAQFFKRQLGSGTRIMSADMRGGLDLMACAMLGVHLHGLAADLWVRQRGDAGMLATDVVELLPEAMQLVRGAD